jgi:hypothetical protein
MPARSTTAAIRSLRPTYGKRLTSEISKTQPCAKTIAHKAIWVEPKLLTEISIAKSADGKVRRSSKGHMMDALILVEPSWLDARLGYGRCRS